jgi:hypothetical protein
VIAQPGLVSICIVTLRARQFLRGCLDSLVQNPPSLPYEIIVVDNGSQDGTAEMLTEGYPQVQLIQNSANMGFTRPINQAMQHASGRWLVLLNPDTIIHPGAIDQLVGFMEAHPQAGICGPKVLNRDGTLQKSCRRGEPRPWAVMSYFLGLSRLFPHQAFFGGYQLNHLPEDAPLVVDGVSGSCMLVRREVVDQIGYMDERFFAYQEDADYCHRARQAGWLVYYAPAAKITHFGGLGGSRVEPYRAIIAWHYSYWLYYRKNLASEYFFLFNWVYYLLMGIKLAVTLLATLFRRDKFAGGRRP